MAETDPRCGRGRCCQPPAVRAPQAPPSPTPPKALASGILKSNAPRRGQWFFGWLVGFCLLALIKPPFKAPGERVWRSAGSRDTARGNTPPRGGLGGAGGAGGRRAGGQFLLGQKFPPVFFGFYYLLSGFCLNLAAVRTARRGASLRSGGRRRSRWIRSRSGCSRRRLEQGRLGFGLSSLQTPRVEGGCPSPGSVHETPLLPSHVPASDGLGTSRGGGRWGTKSPPGGCLWLGRLHRATRPR